MLIRRHSVSYYVYRLLYSITLDRKWLLKCVDVVRRDIENEVKAFMDSKEV